MGKNVKALKALYVALGGSADDVATVKRTSDAINAIATLVATTGGLLPKVTAENNGDILSVDAGEWKATTP